MCNGKLVNLISRTLQEGSQRAQEGTRITVSTLAATASMLAGTIHSYVFRFFSLLKMTVSVLCFLKNSSFVTISRKRCGWGENQIYSSRTRRKVSSGTSHGM